MPQYYRILDNGIEPPKPTPSVRSKRGGKTGNDLGKARTAVRKKNQKKRFNEEFKIMKIKRRAK